MRHCLIERLSLVFAALAGWLFLCELMRARELFGCALMLGGIVLAQLPGKPS
jgi:drug/metabolite transporter (DMT)-like permease